MEESDCFSLIDENDSLISLDADDNDDAHLTHLHSEIGVIGDVSAGKVDGMDLSSKCSQGLPQLVETAEPHIPRKTSKLNLRKSLAWNSAFFESPGFLDADEISTMIDGGKKQLLPGIDEDMSRSTDSISTLASDNLALESIENELFKDIRASIQKSSKASSMSASNRKAAPKETDKLNRCSVKKADITSRNGIATSVTSKRQTGGMLGSLRVSKKDPSPALVTQVGLRNGNSSSSLPQSPKVTIQPEAMPAVTTKRAFLGANRIKTETNKSKVGGKEVQVHVPMAAGLAGPRRSVPKPASIPKASGLASSRAIIKQVGRSSSSNIGSNSTFTEKIQQTSPSARTKKISKPGTQASSKIPLSKKAPSKSGLASSLASSKISLSISPSSSISEYSSASSSNSTVDRRLASRTSIDTNNSRGSMDSETPSILCSDVQSNDGISDGNLNQFKESPSQDMKKTKEVSRSLLMKPSGLRMPSPKIGFFDGAKSTVHTPNACRKSQQHLPTGLPKIGAAIRSSVGRSKKAEENIPSEKKAVTGANTLLSTSNSASPRPSQESSRASMKGHGDSRSVSSPNISSEVRSLNKGAGKPLPELTTSTKIELQGQQSDSPKAFQQSASSGRSPEQSQSQLPTGLPKTRAAIHSSCDSSKKTEGNILAGKKETAGANKLIDTSNAASAKPSQESSRVSMKGHGNCRSSLSLDISSEVRSSEPCSKMILTSTNTVLEGQNSDSIKSFQASASVGVSPEKSQSWLPTGSPKIEALVSDPIGSSKKEEKITIGEKATAIAITVLDTSKPASPTSSQESLREMKCCDDSKSVSSSKVLSGMRSLNKGTGKPWPEMTLTSTNIDFEGQKCESFKPFQESSCPGVSQSQSQSQSQSHLATCSPKIRAAMHSPVGSSKKEEAKIPADNKTTEGANAVLYTSESAILEASQELDSVKDHGDDRSFSSMDISSEVTSSDAATRKPCLEMTLKSTNVELEVHKSDSSKPFQKSASFGMSPEHQLCLPTGFPIIGAAIHIPLHNSKKAEGNIPAGNNTTEGANTALEKSESATPEPSQESTGELMQDYGDHRSLLSLDISSEMASSDEAARKLCSDITLTSTKIELEGQKADSPKLFHESASFGMSPEHQSCLPTDLPKTGAAIHTPVGSSNKANGRILAENKTTEGANTVLDKSESATPKPSQESLRELMKDHGDHRNLLGLEISSKATSSDLATTEPRSEMTLTSTNIELEGKKADLPKPFQGSDSFGMFAEHQPCLPTGLPKIGAGTYSPVGSSNKAEEKSPVGTNTTEKANTALGKSESATLEPSQESTGVLMKDCGDHRSLSSLDTSSEVKSSDEVTRNPCSQMTLTSTNIEYEGQKSNSPEPFQESSFGMFPKHQLCLPTGLPKTGAAICNPVGSLKKREIPDREKATVGATVLDTSKSASPKPSRASMKGHGDPWKSSPDMSFEARSSNMESGMPSSKITLISTNIELEGQKSDFPIPFRESASPGVSSEILSEIDRSNCVMVEDVKIGKHHTSELATADVLEGENNENLLFII